MDKLALETYKTKQFVQVFQQASSWRPTRSSCWGRPDAKVQKSANNVPYLPRSYPWSELNAYELLKYRRLVLTEDAVAAIEEAYQ